MKRLLVAIIIIGCLKALGDPKVTHAAHRACDYGYSIDPPTARVGINRSDSALRARYRHQPLTSANPYRRYRYGDPPAAFGNFYRDRQGFFFYGLDDRYRFGIHR